MIGGQLLRTEKEYRALELDSYSSLATFAKNRKTYYKKYVLGEEEREDEEDNRAIITGKLVDTLLLEPEEFHNRFYESSSPTAPTEKMLDFVNALYKHTILATGENGTVNEDFTTLCSKAYVDSGYKISMERVMKSFQEFELYYQEMRKVKPKGLTVISQQIMENAENIKEELLIAFNTSWIFTLVSDDRYTVIDQKQSDGFEISGLPMKGMKDKIIIDHKLKEIDIYDLKVTWAVENFRREYYLGRLAYIQAFVYRIAILRKLKEMKLDGYKVNPVKFIVADSINHYSPLIYETTEQDFKNAEDGFEFEGREYRGVIDIIEDLKWAKEQNNWRMSRKAFKQGGVVKLFE